MKIKTTLRLALVLLCMAVGICCKGNTDSAQPDTQNYTAPYAAAPAVENTATNLTPDKTVYICVSKGAKRYHLNRSCGGLNHCTHEIRKTTVREAEAIGLTLCHLEY